MGYPVTDVIRDAAGSLGYAAMVLEAGEMSRMKCAARDLAEAESIISDMLAALEDGLQWLETGRVDGVAYDEQSVAESFRAAIAKAKGAEA